MSVLGKILTLRKCNLCKTVQGQISKIPLLYTLHFWNVIAQPKIVGIDQAFAATPTPTYI